MTKWCLVFLTWLVAASAAQAQVANASPVPTAGVAASATEVEGTVFVTRVDGRQALLTRGSSLRQGDTIHTARNSTVRLKFGDGGETVVRPESALIVKEFRYSKDAPAQDSMVVQLIKGGLRSLTGLVGKRGNQNAYKLQVSTATIGIRGTDFSARLCQQDCAQVSQPGTRNGSTPVAARVAIVSGSASLRGATGSRTVVQDMPVYQGDSIETGPNAYVLLVFRDNARITLNASSQFVVVRYGYDLKADAEPPSMFVELLKGGLRFATGLVGKVNPRLVKVKTSTSTIGIRGTVFDLVCGPSGSSDLATEAELGDMPCDQSLFAQTRDGAIVLAGNVGDELVLEKGQSGRTDGLQTGSRRLTAPPEYFRTLKSPEPESIAPNLDKLFGAEAPTNPEAGVFVTVHEGRIVLAQAASDITLDAGESAFAGQSLAPVKLFSPPDVLEKDPFLAAVKLNPAMCRR